MTDYSMSDIGTRLDERGRRAAVVVIACCLLVAVGALDGATAAADPSHVSGVTGSTSCTVGNMADSSTHTYFGSGLDSRVEGAMDWHFANGFNDTHVTPVLEDPATSYTDVIVLDSYWTDYCGLQWTDPTNNAHGHTRCAAIKTNDRCEKYQVRIDLESIDSSQTTLKKRRSLLCHEIGHSLGLRHISNTTTCMNTGLWSNDNSNSYNDHTRWHMRDEY